MIARIFGKSDIYRFKIEIFEDIKTFDFLKVLHQDNGEVLCQVINITRDQDKLIGDCKIIGYRENRVLKNIRTPFINDAEIEIADDKFIEKTIGLTTNSENFIGMLEHHKDLRISIDMKKTITKHLAILAKSGAGKSYTVGVILEEVMKKNIPIVILDPHNEYASIKYPNTDKRDIKRLKTMDIKPEDFSKYVKEFSPDTKINQQCEGISLDINKMKPHDLINSLPQKLTPAQQSIIHNILSTLNNKIDIDQLIFHISNEESNTKWSLITLLESLKKINIYSSNPTPLNKIVKYKQTSIISLKGVEPYVQETFVTGLLRDLFEARKREEIPPFFLVLEEAHSFCPEKSMGELKSSKIIRTLAGEGRKFGIGLCVVSQRPAKVDKNIISQCTTQVLLKITNPNDLKSVIASAEGVDSDSTNEIQKLNIGTCLLTGLIDIPLKVNIRPRLSKHGGETVDITMPYEEPKENNGDTNDKSENSELGIEQEENKPKEENYSDNESEFIQYVAPDVDVEEAKTILNFDNIKKELVPAVIIKLKSNSNQEVSMLFDKNKKEIIKKIFPIESFNLNENILKLTVSEKKIFKLILDLKDEFNPAEILIKTDMMFNEILRVCDNLVSKKILEKTPKGSFKLNDLEFLKNINDLNFLGNQKFEEVNYDIKREGKISNDEIKDMFDMFGNVENMKDIFMLKYVDE